MHVTDRADVGVQRKKDSLPSLEELFEQYTKVSQEIFDRVTRGVESGQRVTPASTKALRNQLDTIVRQMSSAADRLVRNPPAGKTKADMKQHFYFTFVGIRVAMLRLGRDMRKIDPDNHRLPEGDMDKTAAFAERIAEKHNPY
jgi:hypothetical protein